VSREAAVRAGLQGSDAPRLAASRSIGCEHEGLLVVRTLADDRSLYIEDDPRRAGDALITVFVDAPRRGHRGDRLTGDWSRYVAVLADAVRVRLGLFVKAVAYRNSHRPTQQRSCLEARQRARGQREYGDNLPDARRIAGLSRG
jgi:hypothetical protein